MGLVLGVDKAVAEFSHIEERREPAQLRRLCDRRWLVAHLHQGRNAHRVQERDTRVTRQRGVGRGQGLGVLAQRMVRQAQAQAEAAAR